jgi:hypothetical protein
LHEWQNDLLKDIGFQRRTYLPSTFEKKTINEGKDPEYVQTILCSGAVHLFSPSIRGHGQGKTKDSIMHFDFMFSTGDYEEWCQIVTEDIRRELKAGRAILVVFKDQAKLEIFSQKLKRFGLQVKNACVWTHEDN